MEEGYFSIGTIIFLILFIIFLILAIVFIWLFVWQRNQVFILQNQIENTAPCAVCPPGGTNCPACPACPSIPLQTETFAIGTERSERVTLTCPLGSSIQNYSVMTKTVDGGPRSDRNSTDVTNYVNIAPGQNTITLYPQQILDSAGIPYQFENTGNFYPTQILYGNFSCGGGDFNIQPYPDLNNPGWNRPCDNPRVPSRGNLLESSVSSSDRYRRGNNRRRRY